MIEACTSAAEAVMAELSAVRDIRVIAVSQVVFVPIRTPVVPSPAEAAVEADTNSEPEPDPRPIVVEPWNANPGGVVGERVAVDDPGIVFRNINDLWVGRFNCDFITR